MGLTSVLSAQQLARDVNPSSLPGILAANSLQFGTSDGTRAFFDGWSQDSGIEPWVTDGTVAGTHMLRDLVPGSLDSGPEPIQWVGNRLLLSTRIGTDRGHLWATDGTAAGTVPVTARVTAPGALRGLGVLQGHAIFGSMDLWSSDLTDAGTTLLANVRVQGTYVSSARVGNRIVFSGDGGSNTEPWVTDGTPAGTMLLADIHPTLASLPDWFTSFGAYVYFFATGAAGTTEVWRTDGTPAGTQLVLTTPFVRNSVQTERLVRAGSALLLVMGGHLFRSDGTAAGTTLLLPASATDSTHSLVSDGSVAFAVRGSVLWRSDGTVAGTTQVVDLGPLASPSYALNYYSYVDQGQARLAITGSNRASTLIFSDGTAAGTTTATLANTLPFVLLRLGSRALVLRHAFNGSVPTVVVSDGTNAGTTTIWSPTTHSGNRRWSSATMDGVFYTFLDDGVHGYELWRSDGTAAGTTMVVDLYPGRDSGFSTYSELVAFDSQLFFTAVAPATATALWRSDGTAAGTTLVYDSLGPTNGVPGQLRVDDHQLYFTDYDPTGTFYTVLRSDGTQAGTVPVPGVHIRFGPLFGVLHGVVVYIDNSNHLLRTDGTPAGTFPLPGPLPRSMARLGDLLVYFGDAKGDPLWVTDGTVAGTRRLLAATTGGAAGGDLRPWRNGLARLYGTELITTNGSPADSAVVQLPLPSAAGSYAFAGDRLYAVAEDVAHGRELWRSDGTAAGTFLVTDLAPGFQHGVQEVFATPLGERVLLAASNGFDGLEPYFSDGTAAGTIRLADVNPTGSSNPTFLGVAGERVFYLADDGTTGPEPGSLFLAQIGSPAIEPLGVGCPGSTGLPQLTAAPPRLGANLVCALRSVPAFAPSVFAISAGTGHTVLPSGCVLHVASAATAWLVLAGGSGAATLSVPLPNNPALTGLVFAAQALVLDPLGTAMPGAATSGGLLFVIGT